MQDNLGRSFLGILLVIIKGLTVIINSKSDDNDTTETRSDSQNNQ